MSCAPRLLAISQKGEDVSRFKGLGEMNADQLATTTMDPQSRTLAQVTIEDAVGPTASSPC